MIEEKFTRNNNNKDIQPRKEKIFFVIRFLFIIKAVNIAPEPIEPTVKYPAVARNAANVSHWLNLPPLFSQK
jgi:hypothetical protein